MKKVDRLVLLLAIIFIVFAFQSQTISAGPLDFLGCNKRNEACNFAPGNFCCGTLRCDHFATWKCF